MHSALIHFTFKQFYLSLFFLIAFHFHDWFKSQKSMSHFVEFLKLLLLADNLVTLFHDFLSIYYFNYMRCMSRLQIHHLVLFTLLLIIIFIILIHLKCLLLHISSTDFNHQFMIQLNHHLKFQFNQAFTLHHLTHSFQRSLLFIKIDWSHVCWYLVLLLYYHLQTLLKWQLQSQIIHHQFFHLSKQILMNHFNILADDIILVIFCHEHHQFIFHKHISMFLFDDVAMSNTQQLWCSCKLFINDVNQHQ